MTSSSDDSEKVDKMAEGCGTLFGFAIFGLIVAFFMGAFDPSEEEIKAQEERDKVAREKALDSCVDNLTSSITRSCQSDPVFSYCSLNNESHEIIGSGCTSRVKNKGGYANQVEFCKKESLTSVQRTCMIEIYGCAAVTGNINC